MKFNCGITPEEKRAIEQTKLEERFNEITEWHKKFAWFPIRVGSRDCRWLEYVERRAEVQKHYTLWKYRKIDLNNA